eukprot:11119279-Ditylum_brightwellii.AAC.1
MDHTFKEGVLILKARYQSNTIGEDHIIDVPFDILKKDTPIQVARYIKEYVVEGSRRLGRYNQ